jgi:hypothetical protein
VIDVQVTRKCAGCKQDIRKEEMIQYFSITGKTSQWLCRDCYEEKIAREKFSDRICQIFGLKAPGPVIWTQRKKIKSEYGYTDDVILDTLDYVYNVKKIKKISETLFFVQPQLVEQMKKWKKNKEHEAQELMESTVKINKKSELVPVFNKKKERKQTNLEDGLFDD